MHVFLFLPFMYSQAIYVYLFIFLRVLGFPGQSYQNYMTYLKLDIVHNILACGWKIPHLVSHAHKYTERFHFFVFLCSERSGVSMFPSDLEWTG